MLRDGEATLFLTSTEAVWRLPHGAAAGLGAQRDGTAAGAAPVRMRWLGANPAPDHSRFDAADSTSQLFSWIEPRHVAAWRTALWSRDLSGSLSGVDLVFHDERGALEYDFVVAPGADPGMIRLAFDGPAPVARGSDGGLELRTGGGAIIHRRQIAYKGTGEDHSEVAVSFQVERAGARTEVAFAVGAYDRAQPLIIDPSIAYQVKVDPTIFTDNVVDAALDSDGSLWLVGMTANAEFPVTDDAIDDVKIDLDDGYVVKLDPRGQLVYATYVGGNSLNCMAGVAVDGDGNVFAAGTTISTDFPVTAGAVQPVAPGGGGDGFLVKLDPSGQLLHSTYFGGASAEICSGRGQRWAGVETAPDGSIYLLISTTVSIEFPAPGGTPRGARRRPVPRPFPAPSFRWSGVGFLGSPGSTDQTPRVRTDGQGNAYVLGVTNHLLGAEHEFPTTPGAFQTDSESDQVHSSPPTCPARPVLEPRHQRQRHGRDRRAHPRRPFQPGRLHLGSRSREARFPLPPGEGQDEGIKRS